MLPTLMGRRGLAHFSARFALFAGDGANAENVPVPFRSPRTGDRSHRPKQQTAAAAFRDLVIRYHDGFDGCRLDCRSEMD